MDLDLIALIIGWTSSLVVTTYLASNYLVSRFSELHLKVSWLESQIKSLEDQIEDFLLYRITSNTELINHRTERFQAQSDRTNLLLAELGDRLQASLENQDLKFDSRVGCLENRVRDLENYSSKQGFVTRSIGK